MTAAEYPSLDELFKTTTPVETPTEDLGYLLDVLGRRHGLGEWAEDRDRARDRITRHINAERVKTEDTRRIAANLEADAARTDARIAEALSYLADALVWCNDGYSNTADCISEAIAALMGDES